MAHRYQQKQSTQGTIELCEPTTGTTEHNHVVSPSRWSLVSQDQQRIKAVSDSCLNAAKGNWLPFWNRHRDALASVSTIMEEPLIRTNASDEFLTCEAPSPKHNLSFAEQYGRCLDILHYGFNTTVRLHQQRDYRGSSHNGQLFAVKVFRPNIWGMRSVAARNKPIFSAAAVAALHPHHPNILSITNLLLNKSSQLCLVTPYCGGGNLHELLLSKRPHLISAAEVDCLMVQLLRALAFMHERGMPHGDVRLEAVLLTENGSVKLAGFSDEYVHRIWTECTAAASTQSTESDSDSETETESCSGSDAQSEDNDDYYHHPSIHSPPGSTWSISSVLPTFNWRHRPSPLRATHNGPSTPTASFPGIRLPYMAPEEFRCALHRWYHDAVAEQLEAANGKGDITSGAEDTHPADLWATGVIYSTLLTGRLPWVSARRAPQDPKYAAYLWCRPDGDGDDVRGGNDGYAPIEALGERRRRAVYALLEPVPEKRITAMGMLQSKWRENVAIDREVFNVRAQVYGLAMKQ
ncbi:kinase-like domain-containing protein [Aspergillus keveii]|uniref:non-specific serine/threonine protein kinase n=1 Tax=Aspergillus keveii TaxID=714993 RepID=A0ABR4FJG7_9EURO